MEKERGKNVERQMQKYLYLFSILFDILRGYLIFDILKDL